MTDTPRTREELLAIFADGQQQGISAQDMRDFVVSSVVTDKSQAVSLYCYLQSISIANATTLVLPWDVTNAMYSGTIGVQRTLYDPNGYVTTASDGAEPYNGRAGGFYLKNLPPDSVWCTQTSVSFSAGTFVAADPIVVSAGYPQPNYVFPGDPSDDTAGGPFGYPTYAYGALSTVSFGALSVNQVLTGVATFPLYPDDRFSTWNWGPPSVAQGSGETQTIATVEIDLWRIR